ncbi:beta-ketoacyl-ACP synthase [Uliginosibacterium sp. 31-12]|uniref:beta-ketoacyl-ACP synthase n=1 Tax=Uliginosibacterium sp. 31-12 TaxID=3062781 RepID=UPI0026E2469B|nr:beta-ketoacyl-ACP synthase [Uliginosibacterium sp. 31-12]MDO6387573.1 beta-ketoacyl-ACP synthase [Uliginosibacterium sp. 31-12]
MQPLRLTAYTLASALGSGLDATLAALRAQRSGLARQHWETVDLDTCIGSVAGLDDAPVRPDLAAFDCRNNRLAQRALECDGFTDAVRDAIGRYGKTRIGVFLGTSTSGILSSEIAFRHRDPAAGGWPENHDYRHTHNSYSVGDFVRSYFDLHGPAWVVSTACSSSAKVFADAQRMMACGLIDAAIVGGVDSLCLTTIYGFNSLQLVSPNPCKPFDANRDGISIGEAGAFILVERGELAQPGDIVMSGIGESSDAHHMSSPHPEGLGAKLAMQAALDMAGLQPADIDYINLHGTSTPSNDAAEDKGVASLFGSQTPCSSTKGHTGHTLGAAGGVEVVICALALTHDFAPGGVGTREIDPKLASHYLLANEAKPMRHTLSNSFGFGGSNSSIVLSKLATPTAATSARAGQNGLNVGIAGVGLYGPGLNGWEAAQALLASNAPFELTPLTLPPAEALPPAERRRVGLPIKLSMAIGFDAIKQAGVDASQLASVFSSTGGDCDNCHAILEVLASDDRSVSPTRFHNSVHNAPSGYWGIATHCMAPSTSLCAYDATFAAGLLEAASQVAATGQPCLLLAYDTAYPEPLYSCRPIPHAVGVALLLTPPEHAGAFARLSIRPATAQPTVMADATLEALRQRVPAARALPLLQKLARHESGPVVIDYFDDLALAIEVA